MEIVLYFYDEKHLLAYQMYVARLISEAGQVTTMANPKYLWPDLILM